MDSKNKDLQQNGSSSTIFTAKQFSEKDSQTPLFLEMLPRLILETFQESTFSPADSPAKTYQMQVNELASRGVVLHSGNIICEPLGSYDQDTQSLKMLQHSLTEASTSSLQTLPKSGMMRNGIIYQLPQLARLTGGKDSSSLPTPTARDYKDTMNSKPNTQEHLLDRLRIQMYPTPRATDSTGGYVETEKTMIGYRSKRKASNQYFGAKLQDAIRFEESKPNGQLNPEFVEYLMGFPTGFTELNASETQSFHNAQKSLRKQSKKEKE